MCHDLMINGVPVNRFCGASLLDYAIGETDLDNATFKGINRTTWILLKSMFGTRKITITLVFKGSDLHAAKVNRSKFNAAVFGKSELFIPDDGFYYSAVCDSLGDEVLVGIGNVEAQIKATYMFTGIRHDALKTVTVEKNEQFLCESTMPFTDCRLTLISTQTVDSYQFAGATWSNIAANDILVFDGINGSITKNGNNYAANVTWTQFPTLTAGMNTIQTDHDNVTVEYYPSYI